MNHYTFNYAFKLERFKQESPQTRKLIHMVALINGLCETFECTIISTVWNTYLYYHPTVGHLLVLSSNCGTLTCTIIWLCETLTCTFHPTVWNTYLFYHLTVWNTTLYYHLTVWNTCTIISTVWNTYLYLSSRLKSCLLCVGVKNVASATPTTPTPNSFGCNNTQIRFHQMKL